MGLGSVNAVLSGLILVSMAGVLQCTQARENNWWNGLLNKFSSISADRKLNHVMDRDFEPSSDRSQEKDLDNALIKFYQTVKTKEDDDSEEDKRVGFGGLLCCNHPPTKQPTIKRSHPGVIDERMVKSMILSTILKSILDESSDVHSLNDQDSYRLDIGQNLGDPSSSDDDDDDLMMQRRGVTMETMFYMLALDLCYALVLLSSAQNAFGHARRKLFSTGACSTLPYGSVLRTHLRLSRSRLTPTLLFKLKGDFQSAVKKIVALTSRCTKVT